ncbi:alpha/beta hydrolase, partial [Streptomyces niveus]
DSADDLGVGRAHVYVGAAENDPVTRMPAKGEVQGMGMGALGGASVGAALGGPVGAAVGGAGGATMAYFAQDAQTEESEIWFGTDPAHEDFGARRFRVDEGRRPVMDMGGVDAHSNYFDPGKDVTSADNIARIVVGDYRDVQLDGHRKG